MRWIDLYKSKLTTAAKAVEAVKSRDRLYLHSGCAQPRELMDALVKRGPELYDVEILHLADMGESPYMRPEFEGHFRHNALFIGANARSAVQAGRADYIPIFLSEIEALFESGTLPIDVALIQATPPDDYGYMSLGTGVDVSLTAADTARRLIVEINNQVPRTFGNTFIHVSKADAVVETSHPLAEYRKGCITDVHRAIAQHAANLIPDGATLQTGIGGIPDAVLAALKNHRDLGVHTEMFSDGVIELIEAGVINNEKKTWHPNKVLAGFVLGTKPLFEFIHNNPIFEFQPTAYTNNPFVIAKNARMVAINSAIEVDLTGQVCSDSIGTVPYSGIGGQLDFIRGAARSKGGLPIIALPATAKSGKVSRIVSTLKPGAGVVTSRGDVHYVVTEYGVAYLHGRNLRQRAEALIQVAHPVFRQELYEAARDLGFLDRREVRGGPAAPAPVAVNPSVRSGEDDGTGAPATE